MLVKYVSHPNATISTVKADILSFIGGNIATANDFSNNCNKNLTLVYGSFPANTYTTVNATALAFTKKHNDYTDYSYYFRIDITANDWISVTASNDYTAANNTFGNSSYVRSYPNNSAYASPLAPQSPTAGITFYMLAGAEVFHMDTPQYAGLAAKSVTLCDISHSPLTREYSNSVLMVGFDNLSNTFGTTAQGVAPRLPAANGTYFTQTSSGANLTFVGATVTPSGPMLAANGSLLTIETPVFMYNSQSGNTYHYVYGVNRTSIRVIEAYRTFTDKDNKVKAILPANTTYSLALNVN